jgi:hypothetical protein
LEKRGEGRFSEEYVFSIMDSLVTSQPNLLPFGVGYETEFSKVSNMKPPRGDSFIPLEAFLFFLFKNIKKKGEQK